MMHLLPILQCAVFFSPFANKYIEALRLTGMLIELFLF
jgi:hypothetical protein